MVDYLVSTQSGNAISPGLHFGLVYGFAGLGLQPGYLPTDLPRVQFALGYRLKDLDAGIQEWWEIYSLSFGEKSTLRKHLTAGGLLNPEEMANGFDPRKLIGRSAGLLFQRVPRPDGSEKITLLGLCPMREPPAGVSLDELKVGGRVIFERERPDPAMLARLPAWIRAKVNPQPAAPAYAAQAPTPPPPVQPPSSATAPAQPEAAPFDDDLPESW